MVEYLGADLDDDGREFVLTAELVDALDIEPTAFGRQMANSAAVLGRLSYHRERQQPAGARISHP